MITLNAISLSLIFTSLFQIHIIYSGSIALCTVTGQNGVTWFLVGTTSTLTDKTGSVVLSGSLSLSDGSYAFGATFTNDEFWNNVTKDSEGEFIGELQRIQNKDIAAFGDTVCSMCPGYDDDELFNGASIKTWQRKRLKLYDGTYTISTSNEASIQNECEQDDNAWHQLTVWSQGAILNIIDLCVNSTHREKWDDPFGVITTLYLRNGNSTLALDHTCNATSNCKTYDDDSRACLECEDGYVLVYDDFPQCVLASALACKGDDYIEDYYGCKACDYNSQFGSDKLFALWRFSNLVDDGFHYCSDNYVTDNSSIGNTDCQLYKTCDEYGDYDCEINPNCETKDGSGTCTQCKDGYWMLSSDHPCRECPADCKECDDLVGCIECDDWYVLESDSECGYNKCVEDPCTDRIAACESYKCSDASIDNNTHCTQQNSWGCSSCKSGYFMKSHDYPCVACEYLDGCMAGQCQDWIGCVHNGCESGYSWEWNSDCNIGMCV